MHKDHMSLHFTLILQWTLLEIHRADLGMFVQVGRLSCYHISITLKAWTIVLSFFFSIVVHIYTYTRLQALLLCVPIHIVHTYNIHSCSLHRKWGGDSSFLMELVRATQTCGSFSGGRAIISQDIGPYIYLFCLVYEKVFHQVLFLNCSVCP